MHTVAHTCQYFNVDSVCQSRMQHQRVLWEQDYIVYYSAYSGNESPMTPTVAMVDVVVP